MDKVECLKQELIGAIKDSDSYKEYCKLGTYITANQELKAKVDELRRRNFECRYSDEVTDALEQTLRLGEEFKEVRDARYVERFLAAEMAVCRMVQDICLDVVGAIDFDVDFLK